jgi:tetrahydromethanopterin S-methyltransferase subunit G
MTESQDFNKALCDERHRNVEERMDTLGKKVKSLEDDFKNMSKVQVGILVGIIFNLIGVVGILASTVL